MASAIVTLGFGPAGNVHLLPTLGFGAFGVAPDRYGRLDYTAGDERMEYKATTGRLEFTAARDILGFATVASRAEFAANNDRPEYTARNP